MMNNKTIHLRNNLWAMKSDNSSVDVDRLRENIKKLKRETGASEQFIIARLCEDGICYGPYFKDAAIKIGARKAPEGADATTIN